jgi:hypothetical protein
LLWFLRPAARDRVSLGLYYEAGRAEHGLSARRILDTDPMPGENVVSDNERRPVGRLAAAASLRAGAALAGLCLSTVTVVLLYGTQPQSPRDFLDRLTLLLDPAAYGANLRSGESLHLRAARARAARAGSTAEALEWAAARAYARAAASAGESSEELEANDGLADALLILGHDYFARGRGGLFRLGRDRDELRVAEDIAACFIALSPTRRRKELDAFVQQLEEDLERPVAGRCPT